MNGKIIKVNSEFLQVKTENFKIYECKAKGIFRYKKIRPLVGDDVVFEIDKNDKGIIKEILPRKNFLIRPPISNIDQIVIITASKKPEFNTLLLNKYLFFIEFKNIFPILIFTKEDLIIKKIDRELISKIKDYKKMGYKTFLINNKSKSKNKFLNIYNNLKNKISAFTGQTGAGKSTLINRLIGENLVKTNEISKSLGRGKHTTRIVEIFTIKKAKIIDTPGFSSFDINDIDAIKLAKSIKPFKKYHNFCKFKDCLHINEPKCAIINLLKEEILPVFFYNDYRKIIKEIKGN